MNTIYDNADKFRCRTIAWMREPEWKWHIMFTDCMGSLMPKFHLFKEYSWVSIHMNFGAGRKHHQEPQGPPVNSKPRGNESRDKYN